MASTIHPQAVVHPKAKIGENVYIGPFCTVSEHATIGDGCYLQSHVVVDGHTTIGANCNIYPFALIGVQSQDLKWREGNITFTEVGHSNIIRESVTIHSGTDHGTRTIVGNNCALLAFAHVGHNSEVGNNVIMSHQATLAGHSIIEDHVNLAGLSAVHQFCRVGKNAMVGGMAKVTQDIMPYTICEGAPAAMRIINKIGMERSGYDKDDIRNATEAFKTIFKRDLTLDAALEQLQQNYLGNKVIDNIVNFCRKSERGLARPR